MKKSLFLGVAGIVLLALTHFLKAQNIFEAARAGSLDHFTALMEHDLRLVKERDENQKTALHWAAHQRVTDGRILRSVKPSRYKRSEHESRKRSSDFTPPDRCSSTSIVRIEASF